MKWLIRTILRLFPRTFMQRLAEWVVPILGLFYLGRGKQCPICGCERKRFLPYGYVTSRDNALCPNCLSLERHRLLWLYLSRKTTLKTKRPKLLHIAPEVALMNKFKSIYKDFPKRYITADLESPLAHLHFDVQSIPLDDNFAEVIICNHIMEHVEDDIRAMSELYRIMKPGGWGIVLSPIDTARDTTFEDDSIADPTERTRIFGQYDHRRVYGLDYADRLRSVGFTVETIEPHQIVDDSEYKLFALTPETIYRVEKSAL